MSSRVTDQERPQPSLEKQKIQAMFNMVSACLQQMLSKMACIYQQYEVNYQVKNLHWTLLRLCTPYELLTEFDIVDNSRLLSSKFYSNNKQVVAQGLQKYNHSFDYHKDWTAKAEGFKIDRKVVKPSQQKILPNKQITYIGALLNKQYVRNNNNKPVLSKEAELFIVEWAMERIRMSYPISKQEICQKARELSGWGKLRAGSGWVTRFLSRHPRLRDTLIHIGVISQRPKPNMESKASVIEQGKEGGDPGHSKLQESEYFYSENASGSKPEQEPTSDPDLSNEDSAGYHQYEQEYELSFER